MSEMFWIVLIALGYLTTVWIARAVIEASGMLDDMYEEEVAAPIMAVFWPITLVVGMAMTFNASAVALGKRVKENRNPNRREMIR
jgi:hypothetical protein